MLKAPAVVILDEATAYLDSESEVAIQRAKLADAQRATAVVITLGTAIDAYLLDLDAM